ncbi:MAG: DUF1294 domain-containing protein [Eubacterium sp.]|nr:DUF1294 domain-containing protein [Eubacterium sp.]MBR1857789.1 DUF1294 domain-containing protein [Oribacterium sp.]
MIKSIIFYYVVVNLVAFIMYGIDKNRAIKKEWRISEKSLILVSVAGGAFGALLGMHVFRHKTRHIKFQLIIPLTVIVHFVVIYFLIKYLKTL